MRKLKEQPTLHEWNTSKENDRKNLSQVVPSEFLLNQSKFLLNQEAEISRLEEIATLDPLTGLLNRRAWDAEIKKTVNDFKRYEENNPTKQYAVLALDIDFFKTINDRFGHDGGDVVLVKSSELLKKLFRSTDVIARFGGEEFFVLIKDGDIEKFKERLFARETEDPGISFQIALKGQNGLEEISVSFSGGLALVIPTTEGAIEEARLLADDMLYKAKKSGRNHIKFPDGGKDGTI